MRLVSPRTRAPAKSVFRAVLSVFRIPSAVALALTLAATLGFPPTAAAQESPAVRLPEGATPPGLLTPSVLNEAHMAIDRGLDWLASQQRPDGTWSDTNFPALTALPLWAFLQGDHPDKDDIVARATRAILATHQENGGFYRNVAGRRGGGLSNYNTAICMSVLLDVETPELRAGIVPAILAARRFLAAAQYMGDDAFQGGMGYDASTGRAYTDMLNTYYAAEAMYRTEALEDQRPAGEARADLRWDAVLRYVERMQNTAAAGADDAGGMFYNPTDPKAGAITNATGAVVFRSYGSITYAGLLSLLYARVDARDPRVRSALDWTQRHWSLDENPGVGKQGMFFFYNVLAKCLLAHGVDRIPARDGSVVDWRKELVERLINLQQIDAEGRGFWANEDAKWMENNPVLATSYALIALEFAARQPLE
jgi:squalene-hopene/tetraprenyl-beta-curcumene cyclase